MYNLYVEEKRKKEIENKKKEELKIFKYKKKFESKKYLKDIIMNINFNYRTNSTNV